MDRGVLGQDDVKKIMNMYREASACGVPLAAKLGKPGYSVVREDDNRLLPGGWAQQQASGPRTRFEHRNDDEFESPRKAFDKYEPYFARKMYQLINIAAVYDFLTDPVQHVPPSGASLADHFTCFENMCTRYSKP